MSVRIRFTLDLHIDREEPPTPPERESQTDAFVEHAEDASDGPRIGFGGTFSRD